MNPLTRNILAVVVGVVVGSVIIMCLVTVGPAVIPLPPGADVSNIDGLKASMQLFGPKNFVFPFLAHALGTLAGAFLAAKIAATIHMRAALIIGALFLFGGASMAYLVGGPMWFIVVDLMLAYLPMAYMGGRIAVLSANKPMKRV